MRKSDPWPRKPKGMDEHTWHRQAEAALQVSVISSDSDRGVCSHCGQPGLIFHSPVYPSRAIISACKPCTLTHATDPEQLWVRTDSYLRQRWLRNGKDPARSERARQARAASMSRG